MKFRRKKKQANVRQQHPQYLAGAKSDRTWIDDERDKNGKKVRRKFATIIGLSFVIMIILITAATTAYITTTQSGNASVSASDTYAVSTDEQNSMQETAKTFATALLASTYVGDQKTAAQMKNVALSCMAEGTTSYDNLSNMVIGNGSIAVDDLKISVTDPKLTNGSRSYAGKYTYTIHAQAIDKSLGKRNANSGGNANSGDEGMAVDPGYDLTLVFSKAFNANNSSESAWVISSATISQSA